MSVHAVQHFTAYYSVISVRLSLVSSTHIAVVSMAWAVRWLRLALSKGPNRISTFSSPEGGNVPSFSFQFTVPHASSRSARKATESVVKEMDRNCSLCLRVSIPNLDYSDAKASLIFRLTNSQFPLVSEVVCLSRCDICWHIAWLPHSRDIRRASIAIPVQFT
jgi:hypothetical protein